MNLLDEALNVALEMKKIDANWEAFYLLSEELVKRSIENYEEFFVLLHRYAEEEKYVMLMLIIMNGESFNLKFKEVFSKINDSQVLYSILNLIDIKEYYPGLIDEVQLFLNNREISGVIPKRFKYLVYSTQKVLTYVKEYTANAITK
ncbi:hypothetical protein WKH56_06525 [Priestia sp. SB1]|uniref:Uncharacterized protein n=1 Tax=Priestia aryabhattai TaxID=412384 RepID=A0AAX6NBT1_PRIAR|nr:hypothetical protein [Priestia aryabhattai]MDU9693361.1 hypothetical protein [Priestia aryabhattai]